MRLRFGVLQVMAGAFALSLLTIPAYATVEMTITDGTGSHTYVGIPCGPDTCVNASQSDVDVSFDLQNAVSSSPGGLRISGFVTPFRHPAPEDVTVEVSDTGYTAPPGSQFLTEAAFVSSLGLGNFGTFSATGYYGTGANDVLFCERTSCNASTPTATFNSFSSASQITGSPVAFSTPFSLDEVLKYHFTGGGIAFTGVTLSAVVPEPASVILFGGALLLMAGAIRRKIGRQKNT